MLLLVHEQEIIVWCRAVVPGGMQCAITEIFLLPNTQELVRSLLSMPTTSVRVSLQHFEALVYLPRRSRVKHSTTQRMHICFCDHTIVSALKGCVNALCQFRFAQELRACMCRKSVRDVSAKAPVFGTESPLQSISYALVPLNEQLIR